MLHAIQMQENNFTATGSLFLSVSGTGEIAWSMISGTATSNVAATGVYLPMGHARTTQNETLSGTAGNGVWEHFPMMGNMRIIGSGLGASKSGLGLTIVYI
jgi:hypothetical protein